MNTDMVTFQLETPYRHYKSAEVKIRFRGDPPELLMGIRGDSRKEYAFWPVNNSSLNRLGWNRLEGEGLTLFQKGEKYTSLEEFITNSPRPGGDEPDNASIATYYYKMPQPAPELDRARIDAGAEVSTALSGTHTFLIYVGERPLHVSFVKWELNREKGFDDMDIQVLKDSELVWATRVPDDGDERDSWAISAPRTVDFSLPGLEEGVYEVRLIGNTDVVMEGLRTDQGYLVFMDEISLADHELFGLGPTRSCSVFTEAAELDVWTMYGEALYAKVAGGNASVSLEELGRKHLLNLPQGVNEVRVDAGGITLRSRGSFFSFSRESFFNPFPLKVEEYMEELLSTDLSYIVTSYTPPATEGEWLMKDMVFDLDGQEMVDGRLKCVLLAPNLSKIDGEVVLGSIDIVLRKD